MSAANPISPKVVAASAGAGLGGVAATAILWVLGATFFDAGWSAANASDAIAAVPLPLSGVIVGMVGVVTAGLPGYRTNDPVRAAGVQALEEADVLVPQRERAEVVDWQDQGEIPPH